MIDNEMSVDACKAVLGNLEETVNCYICKKIRTAPTKINLCKHSFCSRCISKKKFCPVCGTQFAKSDLVACPFETSYLDLYSKYQRLLFFVSPETIKTAADTTSCSSSDNTSLDLNLKICDVRSLNMNRITHSNSGGMKVKDDKRKSIRKTKSEKEKKMEIDKRNPQGETPLFRACLKNDSLEVLRLLKAGANPNIKDNAGWTPLRGTVIEGQVDIVRMLLEYGAWVNTPSDRNTTPLIDAVVVGNVDIINILLEYGGDINMRNITGDSPLSCANTEKIKRLLVNAKPKSYLPLQVPFEVTPVVFCCNLNKEEMTEARKTCKALNIELKTDFTTDVTHIVTATNDDNTCNCNFAVLRGIVAGLRIVSYNWITVCKINNMVIPSHKYQVDGTRDYPNTGIVKLSTLNTFKLYPKLFSGVHISLSGCYTDRNSLSKQELIILVRESGATYLRRHPNPENIPHKEKTVMFHCNPSSLMAFVSHIILYEPNSNPKKEPKLKYNMKHIKTLSTTWFFKCIQTFSICDP